MENFFLFSKHQTNHADKPNLQKTINKVSMKQRKKCSVRNNVFSSFEWRRLIMSASSFSKQQQHSETSSFGVLFKIFLNFEVKNKITIPLPLPLMLYNVFLQNPLVFSLIQDDDRKAKCMNEFINPF